MPDPARLTDILVAPLPQVDAVSWEAARSHARRALADLGARRSGSGRFRVTEHDVRSASAGAVGTSAGVAAEAKDPLSPATPFAWSARTARRSLGLAGVRALVAGDASSPVEAVRSRVAESSRLVHRGSHLASSLDRWLAELSPAARAAVGAEAVTWCTRLWSALEWEALGSRLVIGRDHWWDSPHTALLALRGRAEVRTGRAHLVVLSGPRRPSVRAELSLVLLVEALRARDDALPGRVVGWWPESGHLVRVEPEPTVLDLATGAITGVLAAAGTSLVQPAA